jgi:uncharacterized protein
LKPINKDLSFLDHPLITQALFHPRKDNQSEIENKNNVLIKVDSGVEIGCRLHLNDKSYYNLIYFHGNAELVSEYDEFAEIYKKLKINFIPVDYRGYGFSSGNPNFSTMISDSNKVFQHLNYLLKKREYKKPIFLMGRSLGSASVLEVVQKFQAEVGGVIIESGFAYVEPLFKLLGINPKQLGLNHKNILDHISKIKNYFGPLLIIHAKNDQIINFNEGFDLYQNSLSKIKSNYWVNEAHHNNIIQIMGLEYFNLIQKFLYDN